MAAQLNLTVTAKPNGFAFLSNPPQQKQRPDIPLPPVPSQTTYCRITAWAAHVQPGSPAPQSPCRRPSLSSQRRPSVSRLNRRVPSGSQVHIVESPTSRAFASPAQGDFDLTGLGYTSVFVRVDKTPTTPAHLQQRVNSPPTPKAAAIKMAAAGDYSHIPVPPIPEDKPKTKAMKRFRSLTLLRPRSGSKSRPSDAPASPKMSKNKITSPITPSSAAKAEFFAVSVAKRKRAKYAYVRPPPPLSNDLALMQFADGGSMDANVKRVMEAQAKAAAGTHYVKGQGIGDVYRDQNGNVWWDADEEVEYTHLLEGANPDTTLDTEPEWVDFSENPAAQPPASDEERRESLSSVDSDLDPKYLLPLPENEPSRVQVDDRVLSSKRVGDPGMSVLSLPSRPRRKAPHLNKPAFLVHITAFAPRSPLSATMPTSPGLAKPKGKARRRPAPLKLGSLSNTTRAANTLVVKKAANPSPNRARKEFIEDSFAPPAAAPSVQAPLPPLPPVPSPAAAPASFFLPPTPGPSQTQEAIKEKRRPVRLGVKGLFAVKRAD